MEAYLFEAVCAAAVLVLAVYYLRRRRKLRALLWGAGSGLATLAALYYYGAYIGVVTHINPFTVSVSALLGAPGVLLMVICGT